MNFLLKLELNISFYQKIIQLIPILFVMIALNISTSVSAQETVKGKVIDEAGMPIPGANVKEKDGNTSIQTDIDGNFAIKVPSNSTLIISHTSMETKEIKVSGKFLHCTLSSVNHALEEVVVAYGTQKKKTLTGSQASVTQKVLENRPITDLMTGLQGTISGVTVTTTNGKPGRTGNEIMIRGIGSLSNSKPLVVIDGVISDINDVTPSDVEDVTVLKDAASSAIYGSRAANGVILITTKKGKKGKVSVHFESNTGIQTLGPLPNFLPSWQQAELYNQALSNEGKTVVWTADQIQKFKDGSDPYNYPNTDWSKLLYKRAALQTNHYLSISSGNSNSEYMFSLGYFDQNGHIDKVRYQRISTRFNINTKVSDKLSFSGNIAYQYMPTVEPKKSGSGVTGLLALANSISNTVVNQYANGQYGYINDGSRVGNPMAWLNSDSKNSYVNNTLTGNLNTDWEILKNLHFKPGLQYRGSSTQNKEFMAEINYFDQSTGKVTLTEGPNNLIQLEYKTTYYNLQALLDYKFDLGDKHHLHFLVGATKEYYLSESLSATREKFLNNEITELNAGSSEGQLAKGNSNDWALQGYFGRFNYNYDERYLLEANYRYDGSSRFIEKNKWAGFPSISAGWNISNERFFEPIKNIVNSLKFRASWGQLGNQQTADYPTYLEITNVNAAFNQSLAPGLSVLTGSNKDIKWETTTTTDFGLDVSLLNNSLSFTADYFTRMTDDILLSLPVGSVYGLRYPRANAGSVSNKGWEFSVKYSTNINEVKLDIGANLTYVDNEITDLKGIGPFTYYDRFQDVGYPVYSLYGYVAEGIFRSPQEISAHADQSALGNIGPGDLKYKDLNGDGKIDSYDNKFLGTYFPRTTYGFNINVVYKAFEVSAFFQGVAGVKANVSELIGSVGKDIYKATPVFLDNWTVTNPDASFPRLWNQYTQNDSFYNPSSFWVRDASYLRLKTLMIAFNFPTRLTKKLGITNAKIYYSGQNIWTFTNFFSWADPEVGSSASIYSYPQVKTNSIGLNINF